MKSMIFATLYRAYVQYLIFPDGYPEIPSTSPHSKSPFPISRRSARLADIEVLSRYGHFLKSYLRVGDSYEDQIHYCNSCSTVVG